MERFRLVTTPYLELPVPLNLRQSGVVALAVCLSLPLSAIGCSKEKSPDEQRRDRVEERLKRSFSDEQVACMMKQFDGAMLLALDRETGLPEGDQLSDYSEVARACVVLGGDATTTTGDNSSTTSSSGEEAPTTDTAGTESTTSQSADEDSPATTDSSPPPPDTEG